MALFVLILVGVVVAQTWVDWRDSNRGSLVPEWAKGMALGGVAAITLAAFTSFAAVWIRSQASQTLDSSGTRAFFLEFGFLASMMAVIIFATRRKRFRLMLFLGCVVMAAFWLGVVVW